MPPSMAPKYNQVACGELLDRILILQGLRSSEAEMRIPQSKRVDPTGILKDYRGGVHISRKVHLRQPATGRQNCHKAVERC